MVAQYTALRFHVVSKQTGFAVLAIDPNLHLKLEFSLLLFARSCSNIGGGGPVMQENCVLVVTLPGCSRRPVWYRRPGAAAPPPGRTGVTKRNHTCAGSFSMRRICSKVAISWQHSSLEICVDGGNLAGPLWRVRPGSGCCCCGDVGPCVCRGTRLVARLPVAGAEYIVPRFGQIL